MAESHSKGQGTLSRSRRNVRSIGVIVLGRNPISNPRTTACDYPVNRVAIRLRFRWRLTAEKNDEYPEGGEQGEKTKPHPACTCYLDQRLRAISAKEVAINGSSSRIRDELFSHRPSARCCWLR